MNITGKKISAGTPPGHLNCFRKGRRLRLQNGDAADGADDGDEKERAKNKSMHTEMVMMMMMIMVMMMMLVVLVLKLHGSQVKPGGSLSFVASFGGWGSSGFLW